MPTQHHLVTRLRTLAESRTHRWAHSWVESGRLALVLALLVALALAAQVPGRASLDTVWGDEGTFLAMMQSLTLDGDLRFDERDAGRAAVAVGGRGHLILQRASGEADGSESAFAYSKPVIFPLLAAPFYALFGKLGFGELGPIAFNLLALGVALWLARRFLHSLAARHGDSRGLADLALVSFAGPAVVVPYAFWRMADSLQFSLALAGLVLIFGRSHRLTGWRGASWLGAVLLAALVTMRVSNGLLALIPVAVIVAVQGQHEGWLKGVKDSWRRAAAMLLGVVVSVLAFQLLTASLTGADNPYRAVRATFTPDTGYPVGPQADDVLKRFQENRASHFTRIDRPVVSTQVLFSSLYVWVGRHTGLCVYFPASLLLLWLAVRRSDPTGKVALLAFLGTLAFYVAWKPGNYFGGETFLGNRYLLPAYPALLVALRRLPPLRAWLPVWLLAALLLGSAMLSTARCHELRDASVVSKAGSDLCRGSQSHAHAGLFRLLPFESTSRRIEGVRDRYWAGEFVRFVDPWASVDSNSFELLSGSPPAEMSVAHWRNAQLQVLRARSTADEATLVVEHGGEEQRFAVGRNAAPNSRHEPWLSAEVVPEKPWRRHRFWFNEAPYWVGTYRLRLESPQADARAEVVFLGDPASISRAIAYEVVDDNWPERPLRVTLRNTSPLPWERDDPVRVTLRWRLLRPSGAGHLRHRLAESEPLRLPHDVGAGEVIELEVPVAWPAEPGRYEIEVDLVLEQVAWFSERLGSPVLRRTFVVPTFEVPAALLDPPSPD